LNGQLRNAGRNAMIGLQNGMNSRRGSVMSTARGIANSVSSTIRSALKVKSPSRVMMEIGNFIVDGLSLGISENAKKAMKSSSKLAQGITDSFNPELAVDGVGGFVNRLRGARAPVGDVVPASYTANTPSSGSSTNNNGIVNILTEQNRILAQLLRKDQDLYIDGEKVTDIVNTNNAIMATISKF